MAGALVQGVVRAGLFPPDAIRLSDRTMESAELLASRTGAIPVGSNAEVAKECDVVVLCVKPAQVSPVAREIAPDLRDRLVVSIAAGVSIGAVATALGANRIARVMPNTPSLIGCGAAAFATGDGCTPADVSIVERIFSSVGVVFQVPENLIDAVTAVSGSGPAYFYEAIEALANAGSELGLPPEVSLALAAHTARGAASMVIETGRNPGELRDMVTSPGGTTLAALQAMRTSGFAEAIRAGAQAAAARSRELGGGK
jgi:pyrroline-5-carboxylate reductase